MTAKQIMESQDFKKCSDFHGHVCPGLVIGYKAAKAGMEILDEQRAEDEEIAAIVETDACCSDAVQVITGCTFGKGNFLYRDYGKIAFTFFSRKTGQGVRIALKPGAMELGDEHRELLQKVMSGSANQEEQKRFETLHFERSCRILEKPVEELFNIASAKEQMPSKARIEPSKPCSCCGEATMESKMQISGDKPVCRACAI
jgi:formylmethanofuran dehydrogenase subunit E